MSQLVLTVAGSDRAGLVKALADVVAEHGGNWERSELSELAGVFASVVLVSVPESNAETFSAALHKLDGLMTVAAYDGAPTNAGVGQTLAFTVLGNDRPGIVREVTAALEQNSVSIEHFESRTFEAPMAGGALLEATAVVRLADGGDSSALTAALEKLADEIQIDLTLTGA